MLVNESKSLERLDGNGQHEIWKAIIRLLCYNFILTGILEGYMHIFVICSFNRFF